MSARLPAITRLAARRLQDVPPGVPKLIAITGPVAVGKSTFARALARSLRRQLRETVEIVATDGFLRSEHDLKRAGLLERKGFPESYQHDALLELLRTLREPGNELAVPLYCHRERGVVGTRRLQRPSWLILEGVYSHQPARSSGLPHFTIFLDAERALVESWYLQRFSRLYGHYFASAADCTVRGQHVFEHVNWLNYTTCIEALRADADLVLHKAATHRVQHRVPNTSLAVTHQHAADRLALTDVTSSPQ